MSKQREIERQKEEKECTFVPKINTSRKSASKYMDGVSSSFVGKQSFLNDEGAGGTGKLAPKQQDFQQSNQASFVAPQKAAPVESIQSHRGVKSGILGSRALQEQKELELCTFKPKINNLDPRKANLYGIGVKIPPKNERKKSMIATDPEQINMVAAANEPVIEKVHNHLEQILENDIPKQMPKGYAKTVERLRKHKEEQDKLRHVEE